jgi:hypothetical protein
MNYAECVLFDDVPLIFVSSKAVHHMESIVHRLNFRGKQDELVGVTEPFLKAMGCRSPVVGRVQATRGQSAKPHRIIKACGQFLPGLTRERSYESLADCGRVMDL